MVTRQRLFAADSLGALLLSLLMAMAVLQALRGGTGREPTADAVRPVGAPLAPGRPAAGAGAIGAALRFEPNRGQAPARVRYLSRGSAHDVALFDDGMSLSAPGAGRAQLRFIGAAAGRPFEARAPVPGRVHHLRGDDAARWIRDLPQFQQLRQHGLYPGIDVVYYSREGRFEFDLVVHPGADPTRVAWQVQSSHAPYVDAEGHLRLDGPDGRLRLERPQLHQHADGRRVRRDGRWVLGEHGRLHIEVGAYDRSRVLVIDPVLQLLHSTYLTGFHDEQVGAVTVDAEGNAYVVGRSNSDDFMVSAGALQPGRASADYDAVITKFDAAGALVYSTYLGGTGLDAAAAVVVDARGRAHVVGSTTAPDFPTTPGAMQRGLAGSRQAFLAVLAADGSALEYATYYGGGGGSDGSGVALDGAGGVVIAGYAGPGLPTTAGAYKPTLATGQAGFLARVDPAAAPAAQLQAASYYGTDAPQDNGVLRGNTVLGYARAPDGSHWITGQAYTTNLPLTAGAVQPAPAAIDPSCSGAALPLNGFAYVAKLAPDLGSLRYASYLSGGTRTPGAAACSEYGRGIAVDDAGGVVVAGVTASNRFPTTSGTAQPLAPAAGDLKGFTGFVTRLAADGSRVLWSSYLGGRDGNTFVNSMTVAAGSVWLASVTAGGSDFPLGSERLQPAYRGALDAALTELDLVTGALRRSTYLGGSGLDNGQALAVGSDGAIRLAGATLSADFPIRAGALERGFRPDPDFGGSDWFFAIVGGGWVGAPRPTRGGNAGDSTLTVTGLGIVEGATARLVGPGAATVNALEPAGAAVAGRWAFRFPLAGAAPGSYELVVRNPDGAELRRPAAFEVVDGTGPKLHMGFTGRPVIRVGRPATYQLTLSNTGDSDAYLAVVHFTLPASATVAWRLGNMVPAFAGDTTRYADIVGTRVTGDSAATAIVVPHVPAGRSATIEFELTAADERPLDVEAILLPSYLPSLEAVRAAARPAAAGPGRQRLALSGMRPLITREQASRCASDVILLVAGGAAVAAGLSTGGALAASMAVLTGVIASAAVTGPRPFSMQGWAQNAGQSAISAVVSTPIANILSLANIVNDCDPDGSLRDRIRHSLTPRSSIDPNDKYGPAGDGSASHFVARAGRFTYEIAFENLGSAALPAAEVTVSDALDPARFDLDTLELRSIRFGRHRIDIPPGHPTWTGEYAIDATMAVRVQVGLDAATGVLRLALVTIDPATRLPPSDPTLGFLPPNRSGGEGQGYLTFDIAPRAGLPAGTRWENQASIVFDANAPIVTPTWVNTLDDAAPSSRVDAALQRGDSTEVEVRWSGSDAGSGVRGYTVWMAEDGGPFTRWLSDTTETRASFTGTVGRRYDFRVDAVDGAGNRETVKSTAEASITVAEPGAGAGGGCTLGRPGQADAGLGVLLLAAAGVAWRRGVFRRRADEPSARSPGTGRR